MSENVSELPKIGFEHVGDFFIRDGELNLALSKYKNQTGSYAFVVKDNVRYVGKTEKALQTRMNQYKNPGPSQQTNKRIKPKIIEAGNVQIYFVPETKVNEITATIQRNDFQRKVPMTLSLLERFLISIFKPEWNR
jgi:hypothetical protein